jgi:hypothetical protein
VDLAEARMGVLASGGGKATKKHDFFGLPDSTARGVINFSGSIRAGSAAATSEEFRIEM